MRIVRHIRETITKPVEIKVSPFSYELGNLFKKEISKERTKQTYINSIAWRHIKRRMFHL